MGLHLGPLLGEASASPTTIANENALTGTDPDVWGSFEDDGIEGFATDISVNAGQTIQFKVKTASNNYRIRIYRMGWYQGNGARQVADIAPSVPLPQTQPNPLTGNVDENGVPTVLVDCGNWAVSASWTVPANAVSGVYVANFDRLDSGHVGESNRTLFVVRNDGRVADVMLQTSDTTWHAYNRFGGSSLYWTEDGGRAYKVSYNRPFRIDGNGNSFWDAEYALVRWLERNGYDVCYTTGVDTDRRGSELLNKKIFVSSGHDEYWSKTQRANVEAARNAGVNLIFMSGNEVFWKVRYENSKDGANVARRTLVCYKETLEGANLDPSPEWTGTWRDPRFSPPADGGNPELALIGQIFGAINDESQPDLTIKVPAQYGKLRFWRFTDVATLPAGQTAALTQGTLGYEWDDDRVIGPKPAGLLELSSTTETVPSVLVDQGGSYASQPATHRLTLYRAPSGALVWGTGTCQWAWGLDDEHLRTGGAPQARMQQATANMLADMG
ncbi:MAG TPA: N,N-dimethylformamidase beta subunit family domain-containing protein, partial [Acidimicrobiales bacterium]|nr:N,N-dimethylformamidase beta subunit family domain-containing protein [Acidimicrobiales bacterium]